MQIVEKEDVKNMEFNIVKTGADQRELLRRWREE